MLAGAVEQHDCAVRGAGYCAGSSCFPHGKGRQRGKAGIVPGTTAARYGSSIIYLGGDIITQIDSIEVASIADYYSALESKRPGDTVNVKVRRNGKDRTLTVTLTDADTEERSPQPSRSSCTWQL